MANVPDTIQSHCNTCSGQRKHVVLHREATSWDEDLGHGNSIWGTDNYFLLRCGGCGNVHLRHESTFSEDHNDGDPTVRYYPPAISRRKPSWVSDINWYLGSPSQDAIARLMDRTARTPMAARRRELF